jgi:L-asparaginase
MSKNVNLFILFQATPIPSLLIKPHGVKLPYVEILPMYAGTDGTPVESTLAAGAKGIVIQAWMGNVNIPLYEAINEAIYRVGRRGGPACFRSC